MMASDTKLEPKSKPRLIRREASRPGTVGYSNCFKNLDIGRDVICSAMLGTAPDFSEVHHLGLIDFVLHPSPNIRRRYR
jgi:hypothetical protein